MLFGVIMAGGSGTRFWPASREACPKQLLPLAGARTMIQGTVDRLEGLVPSERLLIVTNKALVGAIQKQLPELKSDSVLGEPCKRDTAPCVGLAAAIVAHQDPNATMVVMPADHVIQPAAVFRETLQQADRLLDENPNRIVTIGIPPTYPAEIYGYIERAEPLAGNATQSAYQVARFREKPKYAEAKAFLETKRFYWNSGIFIWKAKTVLDALREFEPTMFGHIEKIANSIGKPNFSEVLEKEFSAIVGKSIDYAVMEKFKGEIVVIEAPFEWDDVGNWQSLTRLRGQDENNNTIVGKHLGFDTKNTIVSTSEEHLVVTVGVDNLIVVHTPDATLIANRDQEESIRKIAGTLKEKGWSQYL